MNSLTLLAPAHQLPTEGADAPALDAGALPCWMRLDQSAIGLHIGDLPGYPASAGCIRLPGEIAPVFFDHTVSGSSVQVFNSWRKTAADAQLIASR